MRRGNLPEAPNYTNAALVMGAINLTWILIALWASFGWVAVLALGYALDRVIVRIGRRG